MTQSATVAEQIRPKPDFIPQPQTRPIDDNVSGIFFQPLDVEKALLLLDQLDNFDVTEQRETFEYLRQALNEERAASGERLLFP